MVSVPEGLENQMFWEVIPGQLLNQQVKSSMLNIE